MKCAFIFFLNLLMCWKLVNCVLIECVSFPIKVDHHQRPDLVSLLFLSLSQRREASPNFFPTRKKKSWLHLHNFCFVLKKKRKKGVDLHTVEATGGHGDVYSWPGPGGGGWLICITLRIR